MTTVPGSEHAQLLRELERELAPKLSRVSLVTELEVDRRTLDKAARALGHLYLLRDAVPEYRHLLDYRPACVAVTLTGVAVHYYERHTYWPYLWKALGYRGHREDEKTWGEAYLAALEALGLPKFHDGQKYVGPILMHAGIPTYCLRDFFTLLLQRREQDPSIDAGTLLSWATEQPDRLRWLDKPVQNFILFGFEYALDVIDRCLELLDRLRSREPDLSGLGLPARFIDCAQELVREGELGLTRQPEPGQRRRRVEQPRLALDPFGEGVHIVLPPVREAPDGTAQWQVTVDGVPYEVESQELWVGIQDTPTETFPLAWPARSVRVSRDGITHPTQLDVVDHNDPLLIFTEDGRHIPPQHDAPPDQVWVLHPRDRELISNKEIGVIIESRLPLGWNGWRLALVDLDGASWIGLSMNQSRPIRGHRRPRVIVGDPVKGVTTKYGSPVYATLPTVRLPAEKTLTWHVDIRPTAGGPAVFSESFTIDKEIELGEELWSGLPRPVLGAFVITVLGPIGRRTRRIVVIAEGLTAAYHPPVRLFTSEGLAAGRAVLSAGQGMTIEPAIREYPPKEHRYAVACTTTHHSETFIVSPPHMRVLLEWKGKGLQRCSGPVRLVTESFTKAESLWVDLPGADALPPLEVHAGGDCVQQLTPRGGRYDLTHAQDTVAHYRRARLLLPAHGGRIPVGYVLPTTMFASGVTPHGDWLVLDDCMWVKGLTAGVYLPTAPWRGPELIPVEQDGSIPLPPALRDAGPLTIRLAVEAPGTRSKWPRWPKPNETLFCQRPGHYSGADAEERQLSGYLAGANPIPAKVARRDRLWAIVDLANRVDYPSAKRWIKNCAGVLLQSPEKALRQLPAAGLPPDRIVVALITAGLAAERTTAFRKSDCGMWRTVPVVAALLSSPVLPDISAYPELHAVIEEVCGKAAIEILRGERDPYPRAGRFENLVQGRACWRPGRFAKLQNGAQITPRALLDSDTRIAAAQHLFGQRNSRDARIVGKSAARVISNTRIALYGSPLRGLEWYVTARCAPGQPDGWVALPAVSIACALLARAAARGDESCRALERKFRSLWRMLAKLAPDLTAIDLIRAELLAAAMTRRA